MEILCEFKMKLRFSNPYEAWQNVISERGVRTISEGTRTHLDHGTAAAEDDEDKKL
jgi:hypothetical protein